MDDVKILRLQTGEDVIAKYTEDDSTGSVILVDPMNVIFKRLPSGKAAMLMSPWLPIEIIEDNTAVIFAGDIITMMKPKSAVTTYYRRIVNETNIETLETAKQIEETLMSYSDESYYDDTDEDELEDYLDSMNTEDSKKQLLH